MKPYILYFLLVLNGLPATSVGSAHTAAVGKSPSELLLIATTLLDTDPNGSLDHAQQAMVIAEGAGDQQLLLRTLQVRTQAFGRAGQYDRMLRSALRSIELAAPISDAFTLSLLLQDLATAYMHTGRMDQAVMEARRAVALLQPLQSPAPLAEARIHLARIMVAAGLHADAQTTIATLHGSCATHGDVLNAARGHQLLARILLDQNKAADAFPFLTKASRVLDEEGTTADRFTLKMDHARALLAIGSTKQAELALKDAGSLITDHEHHDWRMRMLRMRYEITLEQKNWQLALHQLQRIKAVEDSFNVARNMTDLANLQVVHELDKKEHDNEVLRDQNAQQEELIAGQQRSNRYLMALLSCLLILAVALFITSRYALRMMRRLKRKNEVIRRQNEEISAKVLELKRQNMRLAESILNEEEKEIVLKEIHHRIKNNLQIVDSLLNMQASDLTDPGAVRIMKEAQGRIRSMAMVHEHIYRRTTELSPSLRVHLETLGRRILVAHGVHDKVSITVDTNLPSFPLETLLPLSLLVNELITNSIKHAFKDQDAGHVRLGVKALDAGYELQYTDNALGVEKILCGNTASFGHELIQTLAQQLNGTLRMEHNGHTMLVLEFIPDKQVLRQAI